MIMKISKTEKTIFNVVWESNVDGEIFYEFYPCDTIEVARAKMAECINDVNTKGHFSYADPEDCIIESSENKYVIMDETDDYWEDICIKESKLFVEDNS